MDYKEGLSTTEELVGLSNNNVNDATHIAKGKRTKRLRLLSNMTSSCSSASGGSGGGDDQGSFSISSTTTTTDQEEEDMANCLILLAQGGRDSHHHHHHHQQQQQQQQQENKKLQADEDHDDHGDGNNKAEIKSRKFSEMGATNNNNNNNNKVGFYIYECKTCNRTFPSFQALGGHRASHKKPKLAMAVEEKKPPPPAQPAPAAPPSPPPPSSQPQVMMNTNYDHHHRLEFEAGERKPHIKSVPPNPISLQLGSAQKANFNGNNKAKIHECSICGSEFTSGQALGGHMRRHRASTNASTQPMSGIEATCNASAAAGAAAVAVEVQPRNILELDLNLPAPEEDLREPKFQFTAATQKSMVLSAAPALVDCHY